MPENPPTKPGTVVKPERVKQNRQSRFNPLRGLTPQRLVSALEEFRAGNLRMAALLWDAMLRRNSTLRNCSSKRFKAAARCPYDILLANNSDTAQKHAAALRYFYNNLRAVNAAEPNEQGGVRLLFRQMLSSIGMYHAVHEIVLQPARASGEALKWDEAEFKLETLLTAEFRFCPLWWFESRTGPLAYLANDWDYYGQPLADGKWLVTTGDGLMEACSVEYLYHSLGRKDLMNYSDKFGSPAVDMEVDGKPGDDVWEDAKQAAADFGSNLSIVRNRNSKVNILEVGKAASALPFPLIMEDCKREIASVWRGGDLGTMSSKDGEGTGATLQEGESDLLTDDDCETLTDTLNAQVDALVIRYLFNEEPQAYIKVARPKQLNVSQDLDTATTLADRGVPVGINQLRERVGWPAPADGEPLLGATPAPEPNPPVNPALANAAEGNLDPRLEAQFRSEVAADLNYILRGAQDEIAAIAGITDPELRQQRLAALNARLDARLADVLKVPASAEALAEILVAGLNAGRATS